MSAGSNSLGKNLRRSFLELVLVSWWSLNCVSVVVGVLVALWWCVRSVLTMFGDVLGVLLMFWLCFCGVLAVFRWCLGGAARMVFYAQTGSPVNTTLVLKEA